VVTHLFSYFLRYELSSGGGAMSVSLFQYVEHCLSLGVPAQLPPVSTADRHEAMRENLEKMTLAKHTFFSSSGSVIQYALNWSSVPPL
jgi:hypothetical protein